MASIYTVYKGTEMFEFGLGWKIKKYGTSTASVIYYCVGNYLKK